MDECASCGAQLARLSEPLAENEIAACSRECYEALMIEPRKPCPGCAEPCNQCDQEALD